MNKLDDSPDKGSKLNPELRERLLEESRNPFRGIRRLIWIALFGSAAIGFFVMTSRIASGESVELSDVVIQVSALSLFGILLWKDRE